VAHVAPAGHPHAPLVGAAAGITLHLLLGLGLAWLPKVGLQDDRAMPVEVDLVTPPPPPPEVPPPPPPDDPPPPPPPSPKLVVRRPALPKAPPPMPNQETKPPPVDTPAAPVFGVTEDSVVPGESPVAVPVGNTLMTKDRTVAKAPPQPLPAAPPPPAAPSFSPVDEDSVSRWPTRKVEVKPAYPEMARRLGIEGVVHLRLAIDRRGNVKSVRVLQKQGYGLDEAAMEAAWKTSFEPALDLQGKPVDFVFTYDFKFRIGAF
jgi:protein TonB